MVRSFLDLPFAPPSNLPVDPVDACARIGRLADDLIADLFNPNRENRPLRDSRAQLLARAQEIRAWAQAVAPHGG